MFRCPPIFHISAVAVLATWLVAPAAFAEESGALHKLGRGFANLTLGTLEIPRSIVAENRANGALSAATVGVATGLAMAPARTLLGAYEILSAPFQLPADYAPMLEPEYAWQFGDGVASEEQLAHVGAGRDTYLSAEADEIARIPGAIVTRRDGALSVLFPSDLLFASGSWQLSAAARTRLAELTRILAANPDARIEVIGHADALGHEDYNLTLSAARAGAVRRALVDDGLDRDRVGSSGFGEGAPVASNETAEGRQLNRRVEIEIRAGEVAAR